MMSSTSYKAIFENNKKWIEKKKNEDIDFFDKLVIFIDGLDRSTV